jgi:hypothetical protein
MAVVWLGAAVDQAPVTGEHMDEISDALTVGMM